MSMPIPPTQESFVKKTWAANTLIAVAELNRIETAVDDVNDNNITIGGIKTFDESLWANQIDFAGKGLIRHDGTKLLFNAQSNLPWFFTKGSSLATATGILQSTGTVNGIDITAHKLRHSIRYTHEPPGEPWNRVYDPFTDPVAKGRVVVVGPVGSPCDFNTIQEAVTYIAHGTAPWWPGGGTVFVRNGTYNGDVSLWAGVNLLGESWGANIVGKVQLGGIDSNPTMLKPIHTIQNLRIDASGGPTIGTDLSCGGAIIQGCMLVNSNAANVSLGWSNIYHLGHVVTHNLIYGGTMGIDVGLNTNTGIGNSLVAYNNLINVIAGGSAMGIETQGLYNRVIGNTLRPVSGSGRWGIVIQPSYYGANPTWGNTVVAHNYVYSYQTQISLSASSKNLVMGNIMYGYAPGISDTGTGNLKVDNISKP